jgi:hypothetical protein
MKLQESHKVNPQDYFLQNGVDEYGNPIYNLANEVVTDYAPAKAIRKKVHDGILDTVFQANKIQLYWNSNLIAEAQLEVQVETSPSIWEGQVFSFQDANVKKIDWDDSHPDWNINDVHEQGSTVVHNNATWICKTDNGPSSPIEPGIDAETGTYWRQLDPIAPYFRGNEIKDIPTLGITNAVIGLDVHSGWHLDKMSFYADVPGFNTRIRWQCRVKDSAVAWVDNTDPENPIFHKGLSFNTKDYQGTVNPGNMDDPEPGWTIRWWTFEPNGKQIDAADARTSRERYKQGVGLVVDPYLSVDEQATYYDVLCDGYTLRIYEGDQEVGDIATLLIGGTDYGGIDDRLVVSAGTYRLTYDTARSVIIVENTPTRIGIRIKGSWTTDAQVPLTNSVNVEYSLFIYPDQVFIDVVWGTSGNITIDSSILNGIIGFDPSSTNLTNEDSYYESAGSEINGSGERTTADYIGIFADEVRIMVTNTYKSYSTGYSQYLQTSGQIAHIRWDNTTLASGTYRMQGVVTFDSATREGSLRIYSETDRLAIGDQYKDREIDLTDRGREQDF